MDPSTIPQLSALTAILAAVGALGTAAFGLVDSFKALPGGGISRSGFKFIREKIDALLPDNGTPSAPTAGLSRADILYTLQSHWINGADKSSQLNIAKSLVKLRLTPETAPALAKATGVDADLLKQVASKIQASEPLDPKQADAYGRFDVLLTTLLDQAYQRGDQRYRNAAKVAAIPVAVALAIVAACVTHRFGLTEAVLLGLIATPIAPIAKDISSAISSAVQAFQPGKK